MFEKRALLHPGDVYNRSVKAVSLYEGLWWRLNYRWVPKGVINGGLDFFI